MNAEIQMTATTGIVLVRPDHHVCWRQAALPADPTAELMRTMRAILSRG